MGRRALRPRRLLYWTVISTVVICLGGCVTTDPTASVQASPKTIPTAVPSNYRKLIASKLAASTDLNRLVKAEISLPGEGWAGLIDGGNRPMACTNLTIDGSLIQQTQTTGYTFKNGQIDRVFSIDAMTGGAGMAAVTGALTCDKFTYVPFTELRRPHQ
jgi:hypothetical protein